MKLSVCELFAGVGGFRCGLNHIDSSPIYSMENPTPEKWNTVWFNQWEPSDKKIQYAHSCYQYHFGTCLDSNGCDTTNMNIEDVDKSTLPDFSLLVGGFPCQDYSVASTLSSSKGIEGKKGVLWWSIREILEVKSPPFVLLENVDRLLKSPVKQRGRDFGIILSCFNACGYSVEWRVINAADYGYQQRRKRVFIFAYKSHTSYGVKLDSYTPTDLLYKFGFFTMAFPVVLNSVSEVTETRLPNDLMEVSDKFKFDFQNAGVMRNGYIYTTKITPNHFGNVTVLGDCLETWVENSKYYLTASELYYTDKLVTSCDETNISLPTSVHKTWQYLKGGKKIPRIAKDGYKYIYTEGSMPMIDSWDKPARTLLTSEGSFSRTTHLVYDKTTNGIRKLTPLETERIQGFPDNHTQYYINDNKIMEMPDSKRKFMMGNALVVDLIKQMEPLLSDIILSEN